MSQQWVVHQHNSHNYSIIFLSLMCVDIFTYVYVKADNDDSNQKTYYYILQWTSNQDASLRYMGVGSSKFIEMNCPYKNCYVTDNKNYFSDTMDFDAIVFNGIHMIKLEKSYLPQSRSLSQKFVFAMTEPVPMFLSCDEILENLFDWTWTYKLNSDIRWSYLCENHYYFYLSFENSIATDYVTENLLIALNNYAIPVVYGGADYSRFLPPGSYLNARELGLEQLARTVKDIIGTVSNYILQGRSLTKF
ncbi:alpha-(1,3)-fucosyltransferase C-like [Plodia interpunctella]|uniref:alpha-(1,3)-fucosyltransferase C-like n=1 Tax=Plodia interpunctella TaxID=58824 RepID=UPI0023674A8E|nr:alpha-(1,3)-fucosyltransferase C-like [Plodia interpunctella]